MTEIAILQWDVIEVSPGEFEVYVKHGGKPARVTFLNSHAQVKYSVNKEKVEWYIDQMRTIFGKHEDYAHLSPMFHWVFLPRKGD